VNGVDISSSFLIEGMIEYLLDCIEFDSLKKVYNFYFLPMVNIDSVKYGNTSTNLTGSQLNGTWKNPNKEFQPEIYWLKDYLNEINKDFPISMVVNLTSEQQE
jgi:murein tripeptide amidase MpaA